MKKLIGIVLQLLCLFVRMELLGQVAILLFNLVCTCLQLICSLCTYCPWKTENCIVVSLFQCYLIHSGK